MPKLSLDVGRFKTFRYLVEERLRIQAKHDAGLPRPWTKDPLLDRYSWCNVFRDDDKTSVVIQNRALVARRKGGRPAALAELMLCRSINRVDSLEDLPVAEWRDWSKARLTKYIGDRKINVAAYKIHSPAGLHNIPGIAALGIDRAVTAPEVTRELIKLNELEAVHSALCIRPGFREYQVALDLVAISFFPQSIDMSWVWVGPGAVRGSLLLLGAEAALIAQQSDVGYSSRDQATALTVIHEVTRRMERSWPADRRPYNVHVTETMLCEYDKYERKTTGKKGGRLYRGGISAVVA